ncbi:bifunctional pyr operon transcriptional regulator/uracil phosphoribosyltransferase PyrR [bacterium]|nr:bifunctional pyr operon transcriptional regulator/uracil phosphoribosyltransferase PyrR [bacterium]NIN92826.1 bifunctional pyr operon transcriptional regulator/uracil phosphoribosyltransferase PyrR [bacterium]NIO18781.1 bifunctional pyr operon transcriptional regulator/uracil phosphoribosyltransferase PyrR [bacterium]NIO73862.1 bifunctional pyr operon transcriptional regulator/uracil phosphoribosyltransferase PyrR [bacterium]
MISRKKKAIMDANEISWTIKRMAHEIVEKSYGTEDLVIVGIQTRGVHLAKRIAREIESIEKKEVPVGALDITLYRDDVDSIAHQPLVKETRIPFDITDKKVVLVDDVLFAGRTVRAALDELIDFGRPKVIKLAVLIDRGLRELPIQPDFVGKIYPTSKKELVCVNLKEEDGEDSVVLK